MAWSIYNLIGLFANQYNAISKALGIVSDDLANIVSIGNLVAPQSTAWDCIMAALSVDPAFIPAFKGADEGATAVQDLLNGLRVAA